ncbi:hypothetical protein, partial [Cellulomonas composti]|uniref:hypothetical protein n=1 Tax=Cellulomonas composti TaxID=266130 RepID=UPI001C9A19CA
ARIGATELADAGMGAGVAGSTPPVLHPSLRSRIAASDGRAEARVTPGRADGFGDDGAGRQLRR